MSAEPPNKPSDPQSQIATAIQDVSEKMSVLVREEIELARAEVETKVKSLVRGIAVGAAAGGFVVGALLMVLIGSGYFWWWLIPVPQTQVFWGFFITAAILFLLAGLAGFLAFKAVKAGAPPTPQMAIDEGKKIQGTLTSSDPRSTV